MFSSLFCNLSDAEYKSSREEVTTTNNSSLMNEHKFKVFFFLLKDLQVQSNEEQENEIEDKNTR